MFVDTHCHLNDERYDLAAELELCRQNSVAAALIIGTNEKDSQRAVQICEENTHWVTLGAAVGIHPEEVSGVSLHWYSLIQHLATSPTVWAIGEIGLDYHWHPEEKELQKEILVQQLDLARQLKKPVVFHLRDCFDDFWKLMDDQPPLPGAVLHCFSGELDDALRAVERGWYVGFTGAVTFAKAHELRKIAASLPINRVLSETDCPYMAPVPHRGKENHPAWVPLIVRQLAQLFNVTELEMAQQIECNVRSLFGVSFNV